ncbi:MAG: hypothetical protein ACR2JU_04020 [Nocardioidaceae bacterium]
MSIYNRADPIVYGIADADRYTPIPAAPDHLRLHVLLAMVTTLTRAGYDTGPVVAKVEAIQDAILAMRNADSSELFTDEMMSLEPSEVVERFRQASVAASARPEMDRVHQGFEFRLADVAAASLLQESDNIVAAMRETFDPAIEVIQTAADKGLTSDSDPAVVLDTADPDVITAYRGLGPAVLELNKIAHLRIQMATIAKIGPADRPLCCFVTGVTELELEGVERVWAGSPERVQNVLPWGGTHVAQRRRRRVGDQWLSLITSGYKVTLNTAAESFAVLDAAMRDDDDKPDDAQDSDGANPTGDPDAAA